MSVMPCARNGCKNIMCNRYSFIYGYICIDCFNELISLGPETNIITFFDIPKKTINTEAAYARFNVEFPLI